MSAAPREELFLKIRFTEEAVSQLEGWGEGFLLHQNRLLKSALSPSRIFFSVFNVVVVQLLSRVRLHPHGLQHTRLPYPSPSPRDSSNWCPLSWWCHPTVSSAVIPFSSCPQSFPASGSFQMSQLFASGGHSIRVSALTSVLPMNIQDWSPLG